MDQLHAPKGANKKKLVKGRGNGARKGNTAGRGYNGQNSRSGGGVRPGFEGGQTPLFRRLARRGFSNYPFKKEYEIVNLSMIEARYADNESVTAATLKEKGLVKGKDILVKVLGMGDLSKKLTFDVDAISSTAKEKIEKAGGTVIQKKTEEEGKNGN